MRHYLGREDHEDEECMSRNSDRYKITVEFIIPADSPSEAEDLINEVIKDGILVVVSEMQDNDRPLIIDSYDIVDSEPAEINLDNL